MLCLTTCHDAYDINNNGCDYARPEQCCGKCDTKKGIKRIAARSHQSQHQSEEHQNEWVLKTTIRSPETFCPMELEHGHQHTREDSNSSQRAEETKHQQESASKFTQAAQ